jgi:hypothetical protein
MNNLIYDLEYADVIDELKIELYQLKNEYGNNLTLSELREISDTNFGGLEFHKVN